tara:strand:- start:64 stop:753 length:690 start_codon:yes stop_codon:yes gene_type:complete
MAATTIVTGSNGYKLRPMKESDFNFFMECWKDFPQGIQTYEMRLKRFSRFIWCNEFGYGTDALVKAGTVGPSHGEVTWTYIMEKPDGTPVALATYVFAEPQVLFAKFGMVHPDHRGNKYWTGICIMQLGLAEHLDITSGYSWFVKDNPVNANAPNAERTKYATAGMDISGTAKTTVNIIPMEAGGEMAGQPVFNNVADVELVKNHATKAQYTTFKNNDSDWASVTWSYS